MTSTRISEVETGVILKAVRAVSPQEATEAIKPILGKYYAKDTRNVWRALWEGMPSSSAVPACASETSWQDSWLLSMMNVPTSVLPSDRQQAGDCCLLVDYGSSLGSLHESWGRPPCLSQITCMVLRSQSAHVQAKSNS